MLALVIVAMSVDSSKGVGVVACGLFYEFMIKQHRQPCIETTEFLGVYGDVSAFVQSKIRQRPCEGLQRLGPMDFAMARALSCSYC